MNWVFFIIFAIISAMPFDSSPEEKVVQVHLIPHSHCDPGWVYPVDEYYTKNVSKILSNVVRDLFADSSKRFIWSEVVFLAKWLDEASEAHVQKLHTIVERNQLEFVGGGWVQNDEACSTMEEIIDQMTLGHRYIHEVFGKDVQVGWQIDPFGASKTFADLSQQMGIRWHVINRVDDRMKHHYDFINGSGWMYKEQLMQFRWKFRANRSIFVHVLEETYYPPEYSWFNETIQDYQSLGYNFEGDPKVNPPVTDENVRERSWLFREMVVNMTRKYRDRFRVLVPFGGDFFYQKSEWQFGNMTKIFEEINSNSSYGLNLTYSTLSEYFGALLEDEDEEEKNVKGIGPHPHDSVTVKEEEYPVLNNITSFIPITNCWLSNLKKYNTCVAYWSGFFTTFPKTIKRNVRNAETWLRVLEILYALYVNSQDPNSDSSSSSDHHFSAIEECRENLALLMHHDAITGTCSNSTRRDYSERVDVCRDKSKESILNLIREFHSTSLFTQEKHELLLSKNKQRAKLTLPEFHYSLADFITEEKDFHSFIPVAVFNSLSWDRTKIVYCTVPLFFSQMNFSIVVYENELPKNIEFEFVDTNILSIAVPEVPAFGYRTLYFVNNNNNNDGFVPPMSAVRNAERNTPKMEECSGEFVSIDNRHISVKFQRKADNYYSLHSVTIEESQEVIMISQEMMEYESFKDGQYFFVTRSEAEAMEIGANVRCQIRRGDLSSEMVQVVNEDVTQMFRLSLSAQWGIEYSVNISKTKNGSEIVTRFTTDLSTDNVLSVDSNGYKIEHFPYETKFNDTSLQALITGNYHPFTKVAYLQDTNEEEGVIRVSVYTKQAFGVSSQGDGELEIMLNRNTHAHDSGVLVEDLDVPWGVESSFLLRFEKKIEKSELDNWKKLSILFENDFTLYFANNHEAETVRSYERKYRAMMSPIVDLHRDIHILTLKSLPSYGNLVNPAIFRLQNLNEELPRHIDLTRVFSSPFHIYSPAHLKSLSLQHELSLETNFVELNPKKSDIQTLVVDLGVLIPKNRWWSVLSFILGGVMGVCIILALLFIIGFVIFVVYYAKKYKAPNSNLKLRYKYDIIQ